jgi:hypothetical protein
MTGAFGLGPRFCGLMVRPVLASSVSIHSFDRSGLPVVSATRQLATLIEGRLREQPPLCPSALPNMALRPG